MALGHGQRHVDHAAALAAGVVAHQVERVALAHAVALHQDPLRTLDHGAALERGLERDPKTLPRIERERRSNGGGATVELLRVLLRQVSERHGVAAKMIATVDDLESIASDDRAKVPALSGWRFDLFGSKALELKHGRLALTVENNKVVTLEWQDAPTSADAAAV